MVTALLKNKESEAAGAGISFLVQLRRWVRPVGPCRASAAAQVEWKHHLDETLKKKSQDAQDESPGWSRMKARMMPRIKARITRMIILPPHMSS